MIDTLYLAWRYVVFHRGKTAVLVGSITLILFLPVGLRILVDQSSDQLTARARATPLIVGSRGSPLELALNSLYFQTEVPESIRYAETDRIRDSGLARAIPLYTRFRTRGFPIVGTSLDYFAFRRLELARGRSLTTLGDCVVGSRVAQRLNLRPGGHVVSSPEGVFDLAGVYPLKMSVVGVLEPAGGPDDDAVFVDLKTAWVIAGLGHGHQDLSAPEAAGAVLSRDDKQVTANASVVQYNEITPENVDSFHFHGDLSANPISAVLALPADAKSSALLQGRYQAEGLQVQIVRPDEVMDELLETVLTVRKFVVAGAVLLGAATAATTTMVFLLSLRLRRRERTTLFKIGGARAQVVAIMGSEIAVVLLGAALLAAGLSEVTRRLGYLAVRALIQFYA